MHYMIEAVTVCVDYSDYLAQVAPHNRRLLDRWVVVTRERDKETRRVCRDNSIECIMTEDFDREGPGFAKAHGINTGLRHLTGEGWLLHMDGDICLPLDFAQCIEDAHIEPGCLYGCNRLCVPGWGAWQELQKQGLYSRQNGWLVEFRDRPKGCYVGGVPAGVGTGYVPIGFFQLWHGKDTHSWEPTRRWYPTQHKGAARTDSQFGNLWNRQNRIMIPELLVFHLEDGLPVHMGENWNGRKSPKFGPGVEHLVGHTMGAKPSGGY